MISSLSLVDEREVALGVSDLFICLRCHSDRRVSKSLVEGEPCLTTGE